MILSGRSSNRPDQPTVKGEGGAEIFVKAGLDRCGMQEKKRAATVPMEKRAMTILRAGGEELLVGVRVAAARLLRAPAGRLKAAATTGVGDGGAAEHFDFIASPADDVHGGAGFGVEIAGDIADLDAFGGLAFDVIDAGFFEERDADVGAVEVEGGRRRVWRRRPGRRWGSRVRRG